MGGECCSWSSHFCCSSALLFLLLGTSREVWKQIKNQSYAGGAKSPTAANGKQNICLLSSSSPHLKSHLTSKGENNPFASLLEERRAPHQPGAGSAFSSGSLSFICATLPTTLMEPVINSALYLSLMLFHSHSVEVVSLSWQKASHFACLSVGCCFRLMAHSAAGHRNVPSMIHTPLLGRGRVSPHHTEEPRAHQRDGTDAGWHKDAGQHSSLNPDCMNQSMASKYKPTRTLLPRERGEQKGERIREVTGFASDTLI